MSAARDITAIRSLIYRMAEKYGNRDVDGVMETLVDEAPSIIGTGAHEVVFGVEAVRSQVANELAETDGLAMTVGELHIDVFDGSAVAYAESVIHATFGDDTYNFPVRTSYVLAGT